MRVVIIDNGTKHLRALLRLADGHDVSVVNVHELQAKTIPSDALVILTGARHGRPSAKWNIDYYAEELALIKTHKGPLLGVCLGFELIAAAYGVALKRRARRIRRYVKVVASSLPPAQFLPRQFRVFVSHKFSVTSVNDSDVIELARSHGGVEMIRHRHRPVFGVQFHPEVRGQSNSGAAVFQALMKEMTK